MIGPILGALGLSNAANGYGRVEVFSLVRGGAWISADEPYIHSTTDALLFRPEEMALWLVCSRLAAAVMAAKTEKRRRALATQALDELKPLFGQDDREFSFKNRMSLPEVIATRAWRRGWERTEAMKKGQNWKGGFIAKV